MGLFSKDKAPKKPKKFFEINTGVRKVTVHGTNDSQDKLDRLRNMGSFRVSITELTPEQIEEGVIPANCLNVNMRSTKVNTEKTWLGYLDPDHQSLKYLKEIVREYQLVEGHAIVQSKSGKFRLILLVQPD